MSPRLRSRRAIALLAALVVVLGLVAAVLVVRGDDERPAVDWSAVPAVAPPTATITRPSLADARAGLGATDLCALAGRTLRGLPSDSPETSRYGRRVGECWVQSAAYTVRVAITQAPRSRSALRAVDLAGGFAWVDTDGERTKTSCTVILPTGADLALAVFVPVSSVGVGTYDRPCAAVLASLGRSLEALDRGGRIPDAARLRPSRPLACEVVSAAGLDGEWRDGDETGGVGAACLQLPDDAARTSSPPRVLLEPASSADASRAAREPLPGAPGRTAQVIDRDPRVVELADRCGVRWTSPWRQVGRRGDLEPVLITVAADTCAEARALVAPVLAAERLNPAASPPSLRSLLSPAGPDPSAVSACVLLPDSFRGCAPARKATSPDDPVLRLRRGEADADVVCAAALDAVRRHLSDAVPVTVDAGGGRRACVLVSPLLVDWVEVAASRAPAADAEGDGAFDDDLAGHRSRRDSSTWDVALGEPTGRGSITVTVGGRTVGESATDVVESVVRSLLG